jgi:hypothetical protein
MQFAMFIIIWNLTTDWLSLKSPVNLIHYLKKQPFKGYCKLQQTSFLEVESLPAKNNSIFYDALVSAGSIRAGSMGKVLSNDISSGRFLQVQKYLQSS